MSNELSYTVASSDRDRRAFGQIAADTFGWGEGKRDAWLLPIRDDHIRVVRRGAEPVAGLRIIPMAQYFGGSAVPTWGVSTVAVRAEVRGTGIGRFLMESVVGEMSSSGVPLSTLHPMTWGIYRATGYELAGVRAAINVPMTRIDRADNHHLSIRVAEDDDRSRVAALRSHFRRDRDGMIEPSDVLLDTSIKLAGDVPTTEYIVEGDRLEASLSVALRRDTTEPELVITDFASRTARGSEAVLAFLAGHRSVARRACLYGGFDHPLLTIARDHHASIGAVGHWMLRVVDVRRALEARGSRIRSAAALCIELTDGLIESNCGNWRIGVTNWRYTVEPASSADLRMSIRTFSSIYSGFAYAGALLHAGDLVGNREAAQHFGAMFVGPTPCISELF